MGLTGRSRLLAPLVSFLYKLPQRASYYTTKTEPTLVPFPPFTRPLLAKLVPKIEAQTQAEISLSTATDNVRVSGEIPTRMLVESIQRIRASEQIFPLTPLVRDMFTSLGDAWAENITKGNAVIQKSEKQWTVYSVSRQMAALVVAKLHRKVGMLLKHQSRVPLSTNDFRILAGWNGHDLKNIAQILQCSVTVNPAALTHPGHFKEISLQINAESQTGLERAELYLSTRLSTWKYSLAKSAETVSTLSVQHIHRIHSKWLNDLQAATKVAIIVNPGKSRYTEDKIPVYFRGQDTLSTDTAAKQFRAKIAEVSNHLRLVSLKTGKLIFGSHGEALEKLRKETSSSIVSTATGEAISVYSLHPDTTAKACDAIQEHLQSWLRGCTVLEFPYPMYSALRRIGSNFNKIESMTGTLISCEDAFFRILITARVDGDTEKAAGIINNLVERIGTHRVTIEAPKHVARFMKRRNQYGVVNAAEIESKTSSIMVIEEGDYATISVFSDSPANLALAKSSINRVIAEVGKYDLVGGHNPNHDTFSWEGMRPKVYSKKLEFPHYLYEPMGGKNQEYWKTLCEKFQVEWSYIEGLRHQDSFKSVLKISSASALALNLVYTELSRRLGSLQANQVHLPLDRLDFRAFEVAIAKIQKLYPDCYTVTHKIRHTLQVQQKFRLSEIMTVVGVSETRVAEFTASIRHAIYNILNHTPESVKIIPANKYSRFIDVVKPEIEALGVRVHVTNEYVSSGTAKKCVVVGDDYVTVQKALMLMGVLLREKA
ncbi:hypothetical protein BABINDRAFT_95233 [Babjeviella inositovora NRRL Y-12698]|uniref:Uncharacterized protein n=1 Tax=Babjeviella inositovora NRRL Y-12698 TaxID=984486 RepID=A0A1E3QJN3_9ASCO|nr:uncharacterized protein BABINDRAFT_95233 [Babjeviella inositovora NRRL Y-12698]ODQ77906.1 hypothetical protein BABINDRAFT_95233 [Babjeviella inositovora NRRL Y-12698]